MGGNTLHDINLQNEVIVSMQQNFSPLTEDNNFGINIYLQVGAVIFWIVQYLIVITLLQFLFRNSSTNYSF